MSKIAIFNLVLISLNIILGVVNHNFESVCGWICAVLWLMTSEIYRGILENR